MKSAHLGNTRWHGNCQNVGSNCLPEAFCRWSEGDLPSCMNTCSLKFCSLKWSVALQMFWILFWYLCSMCYVLERSALCEFWVSCTVTSLVLCFGLSDLLLHWDLIFCNAAFLKDLSYMKFDMGLFVHFEAPWSQSHCHWPHCPVF